MEKIGCRPYFQIGSTFSNFDNQEAINPLYRRHKFKFLKNFSKIVTKKLVSKGKKL